MNNGNDPELCSLSYINVDMVGNVVVALGKESLLAKADIKSVYRIVPVHPVDRPLLGMEWKGALHVCGHSLAFWFVLSQEYLWP